MENNTDGQEVHFFDENTLSSPRTSVNTKGLMEYITHLGDSFPLLIQEQQVATNAEEPFLRIMESRGIKTGSEIYPGYVFSSVVVLTRLSLDTLKFDTNCVISHIVNHTIGMVGVCLTILLWKTEDYQEWKKSKGRDVPFLGEIKVTTFDELFY